MPATRRGLLAASAAATSAFSPAVAGNPDAFLLGLVSDFYRAQGEVQRCDAVCRSAEGTDSVADEAWSAAVDVQAEAERRILPVTPRTTAGLVAKAGVARIVLQNSRDPREPMNFFEEMSERIVLDVLTVHGQVTA